MTKTESIPLILMVFLTAAVVALSLFTYRQNTTLRQQEQHIQQLAKTLAADNERDAFELQERCAKHAEKAFGTLGQFIGTSNAVLIGSVCLVGWAIYLILRKPLTRSQAAPASA